METQIITHEARPHKDELSKRSWRNRLLRFCLILFALLLIGVACEDDSRFLERQDKVQDQSADMQGLSSRMSLPHTNVTELQLPVTVDYEVEFYECANNPGPFIYFSGVASSVGFGVTTIFRNNMKGTHEYEEEAYIEASLLPAGQMIVIPKQPSRGGVGGNPFIWIQFEDADGNAISDEIFIGRCVQGSSFKGAQDVAGGAVAYADYTVAGCENSPGPNISFESGLSMNGLNARIIFRNNDNPVGGPHEAVVESSSVATVIPVGTAWTFPKQPVLGGVGGNPWIWTQFTNASANALSDEILLGRCEQLSKAL
jgi:hypothetical protein